MNDRMERLMRQEAESLRKQQAMPSAAQRSAAIRRGIQRASGERRIRKGWMYGGAVAAMVAVVTLFWLGSDQLQGVVDHGKGNQAAESNVAVAKPWAPFSQLLSQEGVLNSAMQRGLIEQVDTPAQQKNSSIQIKGVIRDSQSLTVLYTREDARFTEMQLLDQENGQILASSTGVTELNLDDSRETYGYATFYFKGETSSKLQNFDLKAIEGHRELSDSEDLRKYSQISFRANPIDTDTGEHEVVFQQPKKLTVSGQTVQIHKLLFTPLSVYVNLDEDASNTGKISSLAFPYLQLNHSDRALKLQELDLTQSADWNMRFTNEKGIIDPDQIVLGVEGVQYVPKESAHIVIDTDANKIVEAPNENFKVDVKSIKSGIQQIELYYPSKQDDFGESSSLSLLQTFTDNEGKPYTTTDLNGTVQETRGEGKENKLTFYIQKGDYPQPLSFEIEDYVQGVKDEQEITLKP
ncbi:hypothetical protein [Saccharibacillus sp. JS10]|uniref:hypothetical protein n=1 Tax=Saccharibacillus sp. JS10 TaxID=2950552 RepID=UPI00210A8DF3|nr:hypothetical protein [Saccharibacillus sp. JS10]MCQ4087414.1 hypothetical protein [Saccharibacillus sp. JS10]